MNILILDTATELEVVAVCSGNRAWDRSGYAARSHSAGLFESLDGCLRDAGLTLGDVGLIGVGLGPGSFTGLRLAASTARMMAQVLGVPVVGLHTHYLFAASAGAAEGEFLLVAFDAKKQRVFGALYQAREEGITEIVPPGDYGINRLLGAVPKGSRVTAIGSGIEKYHTDVSSLLENGRHLKDFIPDAGILGRLVLGEYGKRPDHFRDYEKILPFYARKSDAEVALEMKQGGIRG